MTASVLASPNKYSAIGKDVIIMPSVADIDSVTRSEINAGTNIKFHLTKDGLQGFTTTPNSDTMADLGSGIGYPVDAGSDYGSASFQCIQDKRGATYDVRSVFDEGDSLYAYICDSTDTAGLEADVFAINVRLIDKSRSGPSMLMVQVDLANSSRNQTIPA